MTNGTSEQITSATNYAPYGNVLNSFSTYNTSLGFTGEYSDPTGLLYLRARYYNPSMGTFTSKDPIRGSIGGAASRWNSYSYVSGNPINRTDPSGMIETEGSGLTGRYFVVADMCNAYWGNSSAFASCMRSQGEICPWGWTEHQGMCYRQDSIDTYSDVAWQVNWSNITLAESNEMMDQYLHPDVSAGDYLLMAALVVGVPFAVAFGGAAALDGAIFVGEGVLLCSTWAAGKIMSTHLVKETLFALNHAYHTVQQYGQQVLNQLKSYDRQFIQMWNAARNWASGGCSFTPDTLVATPDGKVPISEINEGDIVLAHNELKGEVGEYRVTAVLVHDDDNILYLVVDGELIITTTDHPFRIAEDEWVEAGDLVIGETIFQADGAPGTVDSTQEVNETM